MLFRSYLGQNKTTMNAALFLLPLLALPAERFVIYPQSAGVVTSEIIIDAPADVVWGHTVVIPTIQEHERIWTLSHMLLGAPQPVSAEVEGSLRQLKWTKGVRFQEIITERVDGERLAWISRSMIPTALPALIRMCRLTARCCGWRTGSTS